MYKKLFFKILKFLVFGRFDSFLKNAKGVIHIGANKGQEINHYNNLKIKNICWIEADPQIYKKLIFNIRNYTNHKAYNYLITGKNNKKYNFNIANNEGSSSSIYLLKEHKQIYPDVKYVKKIILPGRTLEYVINKENINLDNFSALVLDVQGAELEILHGAKNFLNKFHYIKLETSEFSLYSNGASYKKISKYLINFHFFEVKRIEIGKNYKGMRIFDVLYRNKKFADNKI